MHRVSDVPQCESVDAAMIPLGILELFFHFEQAITYEVCMAMLTQLFLDLCVSSNFYKALLGFVALASQVSPRC